MGASQTGSAPAYIYLIIKAIYDEAIAQGVSEAGLMENICQMVKGSAEMVMHSEDTPDILIQKVCSPGGSTIAGVLALEDGAFRATVSSAVRASYKKTRDLGK